MEDVAYITLTVIHFLSMLSASTAERKDRLHDLLQVVFTYDTLGTQGQRGRIRSAKQHAVQS